MLSRSIPAHRAGLGLRVEPARDCVVLVRPRRVTDTAVTAFVVENLVWINRHLSDLPPRVSFADGSIIPFRGTDHVISTRPGSKGGVWRENGKIFVSGRTKHVRCRVTDWLKNEARTQLVPLVHNMAAALKRTATRITLRDTRSRWGSCARYGQIVVLLAPDFSPRIGADLRRRTRGRSPQACEPWRRIQAHGVRSAGALWC